jgi:hypothetical protein
MADDQLERVETGLDEAAVEAIKSELGKGRTSKSRRITEKFVLAALGAIPWVGGFIAAAAGLRGDEAELRADDLRTKWLEEHQRKLDQLQDALGAIDARFESLGPDIDQRIQSQEYLALVRQAFRVWDQAETEEKRNFVANVVSNAAGTRVCSDDVVRLFITWLELYHEAHFAVIREIHQNPGSTRFDIWSGVYGDGDLPREDSAEADLYRMLIRDLSTGGVIRQARDTNEAGEFKRKRPAKRRRSPPSTLKSAFDDEDQYVLTELGKQFVHYTLMGDVRRLEGVNG